MQRLLIVDDDADVLSGLSAILADSYQVTVALDGEEGLRALETGVFDAVLLDLMMPVMDGATLLREMRARDIDVPVVMTSASPDLTRIASAAGATMWLAKPFDLRTLEAALRSVIVGGPRSGRRVVAARPASLPAEGEPSASVATACTGPIAPRRPY